MLTGIQPITTGRYIKLIKHALKTRGNLLVIALAGSGKTEIPEALIRDAGIPLQYINLSVLEAPDMIGVPRVNDQTGTMSYASPDFLPYIERTEKPVVLLIDELDKAKPELQNPMLELMQFHSINGKKLNIRAIICTGNMPDEGAFSLPINHALTNRCAVYKMETTYNDWQEWAVSAGINELIVGFLGKFPEKLQVNPNKDDPTAYCRPSPRSWVNASKDLDALDKDADIEEKTIAIAGRVGVAAAIEFRVWMEHYRTITPYIEKLVKTGEFPPHMSIDQLLVCAIASVGEVSKAAGARMNASGKKQAAAMDEIQRITKNIFDWLVTLSPEHQIAAVKGSITMKLIKENGLNKIPSVIKSFSNLRLILTGE